MSRQETCRTCAAYVASRPNARDGMCRARSPVPVMVGMAQQPAIAGLMNAHQQAIPVVQGYFPPVHEDIWCMEWQPQASVAEIVQDGAAA